MASNISLQIVRNEYQEIVIGNLCQYGSVSKRQTYCATMDGGRFWIIVPIQSGISKEDVMESLTLKIDGVEIDLLKGQQSNDDVSSAWIHSGDNALKLRIGPSYSQAVVCASYEIEVYAEDW